MSVLCCVLFLLLAGLAGLATMVVNWTYSLFFIMGELWGGVAISLLFWCA
jgi:AAA family ATP:ADP antiporter